MSKTDLDLVTLVKSRYKQARDSQRKWRDEASEDYAFAAGHQWSDADILRLEELGRPAVTFDRINPIIAAVLGIEANQRQETKYLPRENTDAKLSEAIDQIANWVRDYAEIEYEEAASFEDMIVCGLGWTETWVDYDVDPEGVIKQDRVDPMEMYWDSTASKRNLADRRWQIRAKRMPVAEVKQLWPESAASFANTPEDLTSPEDIGQPQVVDEQRRYENDQDPGVTGQQRGVLVLHYQWYETETVYVVFDTQTGKRAEINAEQRAERAKAGALDNMMVFPQRRRTYREAFVTGDTLLEEARCALQSGFSFRAITGRRDHSTNSWFGLVRVMKDPARWSNKFFSQILDIIAANSKGGVLAEAGAFIDPRSAEEDWAKTDSIIYLQPGAISQGKVMLKPQAPYPQGLDRLLQFAITSVREVVGINLELLGMTDRQQAGVLEETRKKAGYTLLAPMFDSLRAYRKQSGLLMIEAITKYLPLETISRVLPQELAPLSQQIKNTDLKSIDVIVAESPSSPNNREQTWMFITQIAPFLIKAGIPVPPEVLDYLPIPATLAEKWREALEQQSQNPEAQQEKQLQIAGAKAQVEETQSKALLNKAKAAEAMRPDTPEAPEPGPSRFDMAERVQKLHNETIVAEARAIKDSVAARRDAATPIESPKQEK